MYATMQEEASDFLVQESKMKRLSAKGINKRTVFHIM